MKIRFYLAIVIVSFFLQLFVDVSPAGWLHAEASSAAVDKPVVAADAFTMPAEFEPQEAVWMAFPTYDYLHGKPPQSVQAQMIKALISEVTVYLMVQSETEKKKVRAWLASLRVPADKVRLHTIPHTDIWVRDMGPIYLKNSQGEMKIADFGFDVWSYESPTSENAVINEQVDRLAARAMDLPIVRSHLVSEGGNREFNGKGTMMVTEAVELARNPDLTRNEIEAEFKRVFNVKKVIWLKQGLADDDSTFRGKLPSGYYTLLTTGGHIDEFARFVDAKTILLAEVSLAERDADPIARITYERMEENYQILKEATDQDGKPFNIIRVPVPAPIYQTLGAKDPIFGILRQLTFEDGSVIAESDKIKAVLPTSYLNFVIANNVVLLPSYSTKERGEIFREKDEAARKIVQQVFPDKKIVQINPENINAGGGGMHCIVQQVPRGKSL
jgi:agmatine deiminase